jgi:hypothetical protein
MAVLDLAEIMRIRSKLMDARSRAHQLVENSARIIQEYREAVERSRRPPRAEPQIADQSGKARPSGAVSTQSHGLAVATDYTSTLRPQ